MCLPVRLISQWRTEGKAERGEKHTAGHAQFANLLFVPDFCQFTHSAHFIQALVEFHVPFPFEVTIIPSGPKLAITWYHCIAIKSFTLPAWACLVVFALKQSEEHTNRSCFGGLQLLKLWFFFLKGRKKRKGVLFSSPPGKVSLKNTEAKLADVQWNLNLTSFLNSQLCLSCSCCCGSLVGCSL